MLDPVVIFLSSLVFKFVIPVGGTFFLGWCAWHMWVHYVQQKFIGGITWVVLEIVPPREVIRSPEAMELFFTNALYHFPTKGFSEMYWQGATQFFFSLEIASFEGQVHFYVRAPSRLKGLLETQMYAQYPQAQVKEVDDYVSAVDEVSPRSNWDGWGCEFKLLKPEAYPIRTYVDFGLDKNPEEEYKIDPISPLIELFSSAKKGEQMWLQIVIRAAKKEYHTHGHWFKKHDWVEEAELQVKKLLEPYTRKYANPDGSDSGARGVYMPAYMQKTVEAMDRKTSKLGFEVGIRQMYIAKKENFDVNTRRNMRLIFRQYADPDSNQFWRINSAQADAYPWTGAFVSKAMRQSYVNRCLHEYRERSFFHLPLRHHLFDTSKIPWPISPFVFPAFKHHSIFVLNLEELATIWHFPGQIVKVPTLERIESKEAAPPPNLPI